MLDLKFLLIMRRYVKAQIAENLAPCTFGLVGELFSVCNWIVRVDQR